MKLCSGATSKDSKTLKDAKNKKFLFLESEAAKLRFLFFNH